LAGNALSDASVIREAWPSLAGALKAAYDLALLRQFSAVKPPEEL
jgi:hypothetical protein